MVAAALDAGTTLFDSSPMYGKAEAALGRALGERRAEAVIATKVWTPDDAKAERQIDASLAFSDGHIELLQVHNMVEWPTRLDQIERRRDRGEVLLTGATHWQVSGFDELEASMRTGRVDAIQIPYNPVERDVEARILPLAVDLGLGVLVMRPFAKAALLTHEPPAAELVGLEPFGIRSWSDALLQWCLGHPAITCAIPATSKSARARANAEAVGSWRRTPRRGSARTRRSAVRRHRLRAPTDGAPTVGTARTRTTRGAEAGCATCE